MLTSKEKSIVKIMLDAAKELDRAAERIKELEKLAEEHNRFIEFIEDFQPLDLQAIREKFRQWQKDEMPEFGTLSDQAKEDYSYLKNK